MCEPTLKRNFCISSLSGWLFAFYPIFLEGFRGCLIAQTALPSCLRIGFRIGNRDENTLHDAWPERLPFSSRDHRFALSTADIEDLLAERGVMVSRETVRNWVNRFGRHFADCVKRDRPGTSDKWHLDEVVVPINGEKFWLWRVNRHPTLGLTQS